VPILRWPTFALVSLGATYAVFSYLLHQAGIAPRAVFLPIDPHAYYFAQTFFVAPLLAVLAALFSVVLHLLLPKRDVTIGEALRTFVPTYAWPLLFLFVIPDLVVYLTLGHGALARAMRLYGPLAPVAIVVLASAAARRRYGAGHARVVFSSFVALVIQAVAGAPLLR
jgi:hypothetical protein